MASFFTGMAVGFVVTVFVIAVIAEIIDRDGRF